MRFCGIHMRAMSLWVAKLLLCIISLKIELLKLLTCPYLNELIIDLQIHRVSSILTCQFMAQHSLVLLSTLLSVTGQWPWKAYLNIETGPSSIFAIAMLYVILRYDWICYDDAQLDCGFITSTNGGDHVFIFVVLSVCLTICLSVSLSLCLAVSNKTYEQIFMKFFRIQWFFFSILSEYIY